VGPVSAGWGVAANPVVTPSGSNTLKIDDDSAEYFVGVMNEAGRIGAQAVYLNCFTPDSAELPLTIDSVSIVFPTGEQNALTGLSEGQSFDALVYVDADATGDPRNARLANRTHFELTPSNTVPQTVVLTEAVTVLSGSVYVGFTDSYVATTHAPLYPAALDIDTQTGASYIYSDLGPGDDFEGDDLAAAENGGFSIRGTFLIRAFYRTGGSVRICWDPAAGDGNPPTNTRVCTPPPASKCDECEPSPSVLRGAPRGYNVYRDSTPNVQPSASTFFTTVPSSQTTASSGVEPGGSFFVVTAVYDTGESDASNEVGVVPAIVTSLVAKGARVTAKGSGFTPQVQVFVDGIPFVAQAKVNAAGKKVRQKGTLVTGETAASYIAAHGSARIAVRNTTGTITTVTRP
jgi:hypothetical protein